MNKNNKPVISGELVLMRPHTTTSEVNNEQCFLVFMHEVQIDDSKFKEWSKKHLKCNRATGSGGIQAQSEYDYIEFSLGQFRDDYDFSISKRRHSFSNDISDQDVAAHETNENLEQS